MLLRILLVLINVHNSFQHGYMVDPPSRSSLWRDPKFRGNPKVKTNYNDNELFCGGRGEIQRLGGLCGPCGDAFEGPRHNEAGGKYGIGLVSRSLPDGSTQLKTKVKITAYHKGHFEFRICPHNDPTTPVSQACLNRNLLRIQEASPDDTTKFRLTEPFRRDYELTLILPKGMKCTQCVLQWRYRTGNSWGRDIGGKSCLGCGVQEEFRNCADISIGSGGTHPEAEEIDLSIHPMDIAFTDNIDWEANQLPTVDDPLSINFLNQPEFLSPVKTNDVQNMPVIPQIQRSTKSNDIKSSTTIRHNKKPIKATIGHSTPALPQIPRTTKPDDSQPLSTMRSKKVNTEAQRMNMELLQGQIDGQRRINAHWKQREEVLMQSQLDVQQNNIKWQKMQIQNQRKLEQETAKTSEVINDVRKQQIHDQIKIQRDINDKHQQSTLTQQQQIYNNKIQQIGGTQSIQNHYDTWAKEQRRRQGEQWRLYQQQMQNHRNMKQKERVRNHHKVSFNTQNKNPPSIVHDMSVSNPSVSSPNKETMSHVMWPWSNGIPVPRPGISGFGDLPEQTVIGSNLILITPNPPDLRSEQSIKRALKQLQELRRQQMDNLWSGQFRKQTTREISVKGDKTFQNKKNDTLQLAFNLPDELTASLESGILQTDIYNNDFNVISPHSLEGAKLINDWTKKLMKLYLTKKISKPMLKRLLSKFRDLTYNEQVQFAAKSKHHNPDVSMNDYLQHTRIQQGMAPKRFKLKTPSNDINPTTEKPQIIPTRQPMHSGKEWSKYAHIKIPFGAVFRRT